MPRRAVWQGANGHEVRLANEKGHAEVRPVIVGDWLRDDWIVTRGLRPGNRVRRRLMTLCRKSFSAAEELTYGTPTQWSEAVQPPRVTSGCTWGDGR